MKILLAIFSLISFIKIDFVFEIISLDDNWLILGFIFGFSFKFFFSGDVIGLLILLLLSKFIKLILSNEVLNVLLCEVLFVLSMEL